MCKTHRNIMVTVLKAYRYLLFSAKSQHWKHLPPYKTFINYNVEASVLTSIAVADKRACMTNGAACQAAEWFVKNMVLVRGSAGRGTARARDNTVESHASALQSFKYLLFQGFVWKSTDACLMRAALWRYSHLQSTNWIQVWLIPF